MDCLHSRCLPTDCLQIEIPFVIHVAWPFASSHRVDECHGLLTNQFGRNPHIGCMCIFWFKLLDWLFKLDLMTGAAGKRNLLNFKSIIQSDQICISCHFLCGKIKHNSCFCFCCHTLWRIEGYCIFMESCSWHSISFHCSLCKVEQCGNQWVILI